MPSLTRPYRADYAHREIAGLVIAVNFPAIKGRHGFLLQDGSLAYGSISVHALAKYYQRLLDWEK